MRSSVRQRSPRRRGSIEAEAGYFRRNHWVPVPVVSDLTTLNQQLLAACRRDEQRIIAGREQAVGTAALIERSHLLASAVEGMDLAHSSFPSVNNAGCAMVLTNAYSVPLPPGTQVQAKTHANTVEFWYAGKCVATHDRCYGRKQLVLDLEHYLDVLAHKPGALAGSTPLAQRRQAGLWPASFDQIWQSMIERNGKQSGTKQMIELLKLSQQHGPGKLQEAIELALSTGCNDAAAVKHLLKAEELRRAACEVMDVGALERYARPLPVMTEYDQLLRSGFPA